MRLSLVPLLTHPGAECYSTKPHELAGIRRIPRLKLAYTGSDGFEPSMNEAGEKKKTVGMFLSGDGCARQPGEAGGADCRA